MEKQYISRRPSFVDPKLICSMVLVFTYKTGFFVRANVGKYSSTMEHLAGHDM
jgi:hypothetical protein